MKKCPLNFKAIFWTLVWFIPTILTWDLVFGSYRESEPQAAEFLIVPGVVLLILGFILYIKYKPTYILEENQ